jgi:voltage-gated potassium channel
VAAAPEKSMRLRRAFWRQLDCEAYEREGLSPQTRSSFLSLYSRRFAPVVETEPTVESLAPQCFVDLELLFAVLFLAEYLVGLWAEGENRKLGVLKGRIRYALTPAALVDLAALLPSLIAPGVSNMMPLRALRLMRILRVARLNRFSLAMQHMTEAVLERREELLLSLMLAFIVLVILGRHDVRARR